MAIDTLLSALPKARTSSSSLRWQSQSSDENALSQPDYFKPNPYLSVWNGHSFTHNWPSHESETCPRCRKGWYSDYPFDTTDEDMKGHSYEMETTSTTDYHGVQYYHHMYQEPHRSQNNNKHNRNFSASLLLRRETISATSSSWAALLGLRRP
ncbi:hypothetical protein DPV78_002089 [Talaromyces pinophilus]|nr:hypothetical protein DPV78_002089 [Talaromyces pinophilus]